MFILECLIKWGFLFVIYILEVNFKKEKSIIVGKC